MIRDICRDETFLAQRAERAGLEDLETARAKARFFPLRRALKDRMREKSNLRRSDADSWDTFRRKSHFIPH